jgi:acyl-CoA dehydrogenase
VGSRVADGACDAVDVRGRPTQASPRFGRHGLSIVSVERTREIDPITEEFFALGDGRSDRWQFADGQLELLDGAKAKAREAGTVELLPARRRDRRGPVSNLDYAYIAAELGKNPLAAECLNCSAPDTGNMEVLERVGTPEQKERG